ncbi:MAG: tetratricopeptide repeat protein, partial [Sedimenticolaceae bacterium]
LDPRRPEPYLFALGRAQFEMQQMEDAVAILRRVVRENATDVLPRILLASALGHLGRMNEARQQLDQLETLNRQNRLLRLNLRDLRSVWPYRNEEDLERIRQGLRKLGVSEW